MKYDVYKITIDGTTRYVGYTGDLKQRQNQHNRLYKIGKKKILYNNLRRRNYEGELNLEVIKTFTTKVRAKRYECYLILKDYFTKNELWQRVPRITDI